MSYEQQINEALLIHADTRAVWHMLTHTQAMAQWMAQEPITITTDWKPGSAIRISGTLHGIHFENKGEVLAFEQEHELSYSHLSSLSGLDDREPAHYTRLTFRLERQSDDSTLLQFRLSNFPTAAIYHHLAFYWRVALRLLQREAEDGASELTVDTHK